MVPANRTRPFSIGRTAVPPDAARDHHGGSRRHEADQQGAVRDAVSEGRLRHVLLVDVIAGEVAGNACEHVNVAFADGLGEPDLVAHPERGETFGSLCGVHRPRPIGR